MITEQHPRPLCVHCRLTPAKKNGVSKLGFIKYHRYCVDCAKALYSGRFNHIQHKQNTCNQCNFIATDRVQLDLIYKDGNKNNKDVSNLMTLCANCSRLYNKKLRMNKKSVYNVTVDQNISIA